MKIEQVGKMFTIAGGLRQTDWFSVDTRTLGVHHSVRVIDFAMALNNFASNKKLKNDLKLKLRFGVDQGQIVSGVIGEIKPQFSLFGDTLTTAKQICRESSDGKILITERVQKALSEFSNNFAFKRRNQDKGREKVFSVRKKRMDELAKKKGQQAKLRVGEPKRLKKPSDMSLSPHLMSSSANVSANVSDMINMRTEGQNSINSDNLQLYSSKDNDTSVSQNDMDFSMERAQKAELDQDIYDACEFKGD